MALRPAARLVLLVLLRTERAGVVSQGGTGGPWRLWASPWPCETGAALVLVPGATRGPQAAESRVEQAGAVEPPQNLVCPGIEVKEGGAAQRVYAGGQDSRNVRYQFSLGELARECRVVGNQLILKVGVEGKVLLGPAGAPSSFTVPITISVKKDGADKPVTSRSYKAPASIAAGQSQNSFAVVTEEIAVPFINEAANEDYEIVVSIDGGARR